MDWILFLSMIVAFMIYVHLFLPKMMLKPEWISLRRIRFDLLFLEVTVLISLLFMKPDAFGSFDYWKALIQVDLFPLVTHLLYSYLILALYALPGFLVMYLFYRFYLLIE
ncbi:membrane hypothetical protein [[Clostridium] ultunense Esp]|nr:membrane hypothetical protein [[Clostridium] ultunense Esp]